MHRLTIKFCHFVLSIIYATNPFDELLGKRFMTEMFQARRWSFIIFESDPNVLNFRDIIIL